MAANVGRSACAYRTAFRSEGNAATRLGSFEGIAAASRAQEWLAEVTGQQVPYSIQHLLDRARWDADAVRYNVRTYALEYLADPDAVLVVDEIGVPKKGHQSVGVSRQHSGTVGRIENCQIGVFLAYVNSKGQVLIDREPYLLPE